jgi:hypothetical protein
VDFMNSRFLATVFLLAAVLLAPSLVRADFVSLSGAENSANIAVVNVESDRVMIALEVFVEDIEVFEDALPDEWYRELAAQRDPEAERWLRFGEDVLRVEADGRPLPVRVDLAEPRMRVERYSPMAGKLNPFTGMRVPGPPVDPRVIYLDLTYLFPAGSPPGTLTISPPMGDGGFPLAIIGFTLNHQGVQVVDFKVLNEKAVLQLDWEDPWYSRFENRGLQRWQQSGLMTFLYIEPYEVRHEMLVRVKDLLPMLDLELRDEAWIEEDEFRAVEGKLGQFLLAHSNVVIDDVRGEGILDKVNFVQYTRRKTTFLTEPERLNVPQAKLGVVVTYFTDGIPQQVDMTWDLFTPRIQNVPANAIDPAGPFPSTLTPEDPVHTWINYLKTYEIPTVDAVVVEEGQLPRRVPVLSLVLLLGLIPVGLSLRSRVRAGWSIRGRLVMGGALLVLGLVLGFVWPLGTVDIPSGNDPDEEQNLALMENLLRNVYRAFDFRAEEDVYDKLAVTVAGDLLTDIYLQSRQSLVVEQAGGAQAKVEEVVVESAEPSRAGKGYVFDTTWTAGGSVGHWGHVHMRINRFQANVTIEPVDGAWKITGMEVLDEVRIDPGAG